MIWVHYAGILPLTFECPAKDTPGLLNTGDLDKVKSMINTARQKHFELEQDPKRKGPMTQYSDQRFDVCLYLTGPHALGKGDLTYMSQLSELLPVVPLFAKVKPT
jgi:septin family protein